MQISAKTLLNISLTHGIWGYCKVVYKYYSLLGSDFLQFGWHHFGGTKCLHLQGRRQIEKVPMNHTYENARCHSPKKNYLLCIYYSTTKIHFFDFTSKTRQPLFLYRICNIRCPHFWILTFSAVNQHLLNISEPHFFQDLNIFSERGAQIVPLILHTPHTCCVCPLIKQCRRYLKPHTHFKQS